MLPSPCSTPLHACWFVEQTIDTLFVCSYTWLNKTDPVFSRVSVKLWHRTLTISDSDINNRQTLITVAAVTADDHNTFSWNNNVRQVDGTDLSPWKPSPCCSWRRVHAGWVSHNARPPALPRCTRTESWSVDGKQQDVQHDTHTHSFNRSLLPSNRQICSHFKWRDRVCVCVCVHNCMFVCVFIHVWSYITL